MKILQVSDAFYPDVDGPIEVMVNIAKEFKRNGWGEVDLLVPSYPQKVEVEGLNIYRCKSVALGGYRACLPAFDRRVKALFKAKNGEKYDLVHLHSPFPLARFALKAAKKAGIPVIITVHTKFEDELKNRVKFKPVRNFVMNYLIKTFNGGDAVTSVSKGMKDTLYEYGYSGKKSVPVIYNSANVVRADGEKTERLRERLGLNGKTAFLFVGRLVKVKNVQFSFETLSIVKKRGYDDFKFIIVGDGEYEKTLKKLVKSYNLENNVEFEGRISDKNLLAQYYRACDALLFPSVFDSFGIVVIEAAVNGLPAVTVTDSCAAERIKNGENGFAWGYDVNLWANNLIELMKNPDLMKRAGEGARDSLYLSPERIAEQYRELYIRTLRDYK